MKSLLLALYLIVSVAQAQNTVTITHQRYTTTFDTVLHYPVMVHWVVTRENISCAPTIHRTNDFRPDSALFTATDEKADYHLGSAKYDRGHNMPAADNECDITQMHECFYFSNMTAQTKHLNEITWEHLEDRTRAIADSVGSVEVWCGSYGIIEKIGKVSVPAFCWKIIKYNNVVQAYIFPNTATVNQEPFGFYVTTVSSVRNASRLPLTEIPNF